MYQFEREPMKDRDTTDGLFVLEALYTDQDTHVPTLEELKSQLTQVNQGGEI